MLLASYVTQLNERIDALVLEKSALIRERDDLQRQLDAVTIENNVLVKICGDAIDVWREREWQR